ncbi:MAG: LD-carboxypeptidase [Chitinophagales bacterium]|nr:LD-carboxypeptidase [Chitinophagales bacterium]
MRKPPSLKKGDTIGILSTARKISKEELSNCINFLESFGFNIQTGKTIGAEFHQFAGDDTCRTEDLQAMLNDDGINAILCARGGYGTVRIIDSIDYSKFVKNPKWIAGYSDVTALHMMVNTKLAVQSLHSPMPLGFEELTEQSKKSLVDALFGHPLNYTIPSHPLNKGGEDTSVLFGGNLSVLYSLTGSTNGGVPTGSFLFIEDLDEYLYHIDRMMMNFRRSGKLNMLKGLVIGGMTDMNDNTIPYGMDAVEIIISHVKDKPIPVCFGFPAGHIKDNRTLVLGKEYRFKVDSATVELKAVD